jgi:hypothetical protein
MTQHRGVSFYPLEQVATDDLHSMQDRLYSEIQRRAVSLAIHDSSLGLEDLFTGGAVLSGLSVVGGIGASTVRVSSGEGLIYDGTATGDESVFRLVRVSSQEAGGYLEFTITADPGSPRIVAITAAASVATLSGDTYSVPMKNGSQIQMVTKAKRSRGSASIVATHGTPSATPTLPTLPANSLLLGYVYVPAGATTSASFIITDSRRFISAAGAESGGVGVLAGLGLVLSTGANFVVSAGTAILNGQSRAIGSGTYSWTSTHDQSSLTFNATHYVYLNIGKHHRMDGADRVITSLTAPDAAGIHPGSALALTASLNPVLKLSGSDPAEMLYLGRLLIDGGGYVVNAVGVADERSGGELHSGLETHTGIETHSGTVTHNGTLNTNSDQFHVGTEFHGGEETHTGISSFSNLSVQGVRIYGNDWISGNFTSGSYGIVYASSGTYVYLPISSTAGRTSPASGMSSTTGSVTLPANGIFEIHASLVCYTLEDIAGYSLYLKPQVLGSANPTSNHDAAGIGYGSSSGGTLNVPNEFVSVAWNGIIDWSSDSAAKTLTFGAKQSNAFTRTFTIVSGSFTVRRLN